MEERESGPRRAGCPAGRGVQVAPPIRIKVPLGIGGAPGKGGSPLLSPPSQKSTICAAVAPAKPDTTTSAPQALQLPSAHSRAHGSDASARGRKRSAEHFYDPADNGSYPARSGGAPWQELGTGELGPGADPGHPMEWVPAAEHAGQAHAVRPVTGQQQVRAPTAFPLEFFDNPELDAALKRRLAEAPEGVGVPGVSRFYDTQGSFTWAPCSVLEYSEGSEMYKVQWTATGRMKWVKRLNLIIEGEPAASFQSRLQQARRLQKEAERDARYHEYVGKQPFNNREILDEAMLARVLRRASVAAATAQSECVQGFIQAARASYQHAVKCAIVDHQFAFEASRMALAAANVQPNKVAAVVPELGCVPLAKLPVGCTVVGTGGGTGQGHAEELQLMEFALALADVTAVSTLTKGPLLQLIQSYYSELDIRGMVMVDTVLEDIQLPATLDEFCTAQQTRLDDIMDALFTDWLLKVMSMLEKLMVDEEDSRGPSAAGGLYDEDSMQATPTAYPSLSSGTAALAGAIDSSQQAGSGLQQQQQQLEQLDQALVNCFVKMVALTMSDQLRTTVLNSIEAYQKFWSSYDFKPNSVAATAGRPCSLLMAEGPAAETPGGLVQPDQSVKVHNAAPRWGADLYMAAPGPVFRVSLLLASTGIWYVPSLEDVTAKVLAVYDDMITRPQDIEDIHSKMQRSVTEVRPMTAVSPTEPAAVAGCANVLRIVELNLQAPRELQTDFAETFREVLGMEDSAAYVRGWMEAGRSLEETRAEVLRLQQMADAVAGRSEAVVRFSMLEVHCGALQGAMQERVLAARSMLLAAVAKSWASSNQLVVTRFVEITARLNEVPETPEAMDDLEKFVGGLDAELEAQQAHIAGSTLVWEALQEAKHPVQEGDSQLFWKLSMGPQQVGEELESVRSRLGRFRGRYMAQLKVDQSRLVADLEDMKKEAEALATLGDISQVDDRCSLVQDLESRLEACSQQAQLYNSREEIFLLPRSEYPQIEAITKFFEPYSQVWKMCAQWAGSLPEWMDGPFTEVDTELVASECDKWWRSCAKLCKVLQGEPLKVIITLRTKLQDFQHHLPLITALRNPGLRDRHWDQISAKVGFPVKADAGFSVSRALQLGLPQFLPALEDISDQAGREFSLERALDKMQADWAGIAFETLVWRTTGTTILKGVDEIQMLLDDQCIKTQSMRASPYIGPFEERVKLWEAKLNLTQEILDQWLQAQAGWLYLEPIFGSEDIMQQMPNEGRKFHAVDATWRATMEQLAKNAEVLVVCGDAELLKNLTEANKLLEQVQKGLSDYLETKRQAFPRFYFLSNEELLEILAETKDPQRVQPFLRKLFEGINQLQFQPDLEVTAMVSEEGEKIDFARPFNPKHAGGNVEKWLIDCESSMRSTVKSVLQQAFDAYATRERIKWLLEWPGQVVICVSSMYWSNEVAEAITTGTLPHYADQCTDELMKVVNKVRGQLSKLERRTLSALIVIDVHARDVVTELATDKITSATDFSWMSQLRYYWEGGEVTVRMINAAIGYGYEYLGNGGRLVITPLTDRCYRTLCGALHLNLGGAPEGPAGTGKTETTKDLAKAIAMQCVVFNCSDGLDYLAMAKFFKGLASSGAWACFDEFNRIDLEVLSVIAQQILTMQRAKAAGVKSFEFEGTKLSLRPTFSVFITMNPGYAGRSELPDNLKALFRSVAMMVPDYALISEIMLYSSGYLNARDLARKLVATYRLCSEQLSSQSHYDYGMRAVMSVLRAAASNKQKFGDQAEDILMLRSIKDVNAPKFLAPDIPLFEGILADLFPGVELPEADYKALDEALLANCTAANLQAVPVFIEKAHQLYEMILVRHGLMIVGLSYGAKTAIYKMLAGALGDLEERNLMHEHRVQVHCLNPKSVPMGQLYGQFDPVSHEWQDGVLARIFRECATDTSPDRKWVMFDGPVDAVWIENMNTVLDDNKKLCLNSGEIIQMSTSMNMIFEVADLAVASPATVSRCGMVYVEPSQVGWRPLRDSWENNLPAAFGAALTKRLHTLFEWLIDPCIAFLRKNCKELVPTADISLPVSLMHLFWSLIDELHNPGSADMVSTKDLPKYVDCVFLFSLVWSVGASTDNEGRVQFSDFLRKLTAQEVERGADRKDFDLGPGQEIIDPGFKLSLQMPKEGTVYDYIFEKAKLQWKHWLQLSPPTAVPESVAYTKIIVPTLDTVRYSYLMQLLITHGKHVLFAGPTGTGKTVYIKRHLEQMDKAAYSSIQTAFSAQTSANQVQDIIDNQLDRRRKGAYGPPVGIKCIIFVDDLNMPAPEVYGAQPPIELLRQFMDHGGWYGRGDNLFRTILDVQFVAAMGPPCGGRNPITPRFVRHFNLITINEFDDDTYSRIYQAIMDWWFRRSKVGDEARNKGNAVVKATVDVYNTIRRELLPTPAKSHYTYNMRDISKVFQGMQMVGVPVEDAKQLCRLWAHESLRVFHDRLVNDEDRAWFCNLLKETTNKHMGLKFENVFPPPDGSSLSKGDTAVLRQVLLCDFLGSLGADGDRKYQEVQSLPKLLSTLEEQLSEYNAQSRSRMDLAMFLYAAEHVCRISRIIRQPFGNGLLVGVGGSGRQSLSRLAAFMAEYKVFSIEVSRSYGTAEWREDLRRVLRQAGGAGSGTVLILSDTQIKEESFLEDVSSILNTGVVPNLFPKEDVPAILEAVTPRARKAGVGLAPQQLMAFFEEQCRANLHMLLCMSPVGDAFRERLRKFPSLVNCTTIDWFSEWPSDALKSVASRFLGEVEMDTDATRSAVEDMCMSFHTSVRSLAAQFLRETHRHVYVTPTSYLELIQTYKDLLSKKRTQVNLLKRRYEVGLQKLLAAEAEVSTMKVELIELQPKLIETGKEVQETLVVVDRETKEAEAQKEVVAGEEAVANEKAAAAKAIKDECEGELAVALPMLQAALDALDTLTKADITEVKSMKSPPAVVKLVMEAVCTMLSVKPKKVNDPANPAKKIDDYWTPSQGLLGEANFLQKLQEYDKDNIQPAIITAIRPYIANEDFNADTVKKASKAAYGLCCWVRAMEAYDRVAKVVAPKKEKLAAAEAEYGVLMAGLAEKKAALAALEARLAALNSKLKEMQARKVQLEADVALCEAKLRRATELIGGLGGEKARWTEVAQKLGGDYVNLTGDVLLSAGFIAYLGPFVGTYREQAVGEWAKACSDKGIPCSAVFKLAAVLGEPVKIREWAADGLPNDGFSIENAIIMTRARRWPLLVDPQGQANKWLKQMERKARLEVLKLSDGDYIRRLESCIQLGTPALIENVGEELDPTLEPLLLKATFKQGGTLCIKLGENTVEYSPSFRLYLTTKMRAPHYLPEVAVKVALIEFGITREGLADQVLGVTVARERPELEEEKGRLVLQGVQNAAQLAEIEDRIIEVLSGGEGNILEDETAIQVISSSKTLSTEITHKQQIAERTEKKIDEARAAYQPLAHNVSVLFFCITELAAIEPMYQYSLAWFIALYENSLAKAEKSNVLQQRMQHLVQHFTHSLYVNICRSLFEKDKLLFSFSLCTSIRIHVTKALDAAALRFLLTGGVATGSTPVSPAPWLADRQWGEMVRLSTSLAPFQGLMDDFQATTAPWQAIYDSVAPEAEPLPSPWQDKLDSFQKLLVLRVLRPDKLVLAVQQYVLEQMGQQYVEPPPFDLDKCFQDSTPLTPLIFVLSPGADPMSVLLKYADTCRIQVEAISLGQGQGPKAAKMIEQARTSGGWVVLQNCHLATSWMPALERICEQLPAGPVHPTLRLWLTSYPSPAFPVSVLQDGIKMTSDPPSGLRANLLASFLSDPVSDPGFMSSTSRPGPFNKLLFGLCFFHAFVQERLKFGPLGWNVPYQFSQPDFAISARQLHMFIKESGDGPIPLPALRYLAGECNYGGRVTDAHDRRTLMSILQVFYSDSILDDGHRFSPSGLYYAPPEGPLSATVDYIRSLPLVAAPEVFGLHANADITKDQQQTDLLLSSLLSMQGASSSGGGSSREEVTRALAADIAARLPPVFDLEAARYKYPVQYYESMNTVLTQELVRYNRLIQVVHTSLRELQRALRGEVLLSADLEAVGNAMFDGRVPAMWMGKSYPSMKPLGSYVEDLLERISMMQGWIDGGAPTVYWMAGFFFVHAFLTGVKQNFARKHHLAIDTVAFDFTCLPPRHACGQPPDDGAYVRGMFVEGARWDAEAMQLEESQPKVLYTPAPMMLLSPCEAANQKQYPHYQCPLYLTPERRGVLATTGHSTNFVTDLMIPSDRPQDHWIRRGVAFLLSLAS